MPLTELKVLDPLYIDSNPSEVNLDCLSDLMRIKKNELAKAFRITPQRLSANPYDSSNSVLKKWMLVFNLLITIISDTEPGLSEGDVRAKMLRWLRMPRPEFLGNSALDFMLKGKVRRVINLLEQLSV